MKFTYVVGKNCEVVRYFMILTKFHNNWKAYAWLRIWVYTHSFGYVEKDWTADSCVNKFYSGYAANENDCKFYCKF